MKNTAKTLIFLVLFILLCLNLSACKNENKSQRLEENGTNVSNALHSSDNTAKYSEDTELGKGSKTAIVEVKMPDKTVRFTLHTDSDTVGDALLENKLISGDQGQFGLYVKEVNGVVADFDVDQSYWAFYINGEMAMSGVDGTEITEGTVYSLEYTK